MIFLQCLILQAETNNFDTFVYNGAVCFPVDEARQLLEEHRNIKLFQDKIIYLEDQTNIYSSYTMLLENHVKQFKKQKIKVFFNGVLIGSGVTIIGAIIIIIKLAL